MSCVSTPTATQFSTFTSTSVSTSFSDSVTTLPDTTSTSLITSCLESAGASASGSSDAGPGTCISSTVITSTTVIDGGVSTTQVPFEVTDITTGSVPTNTLFAPCTDGPTDSGSPTITTPTTSTSTSSSTSFTDSSTTIVITPTTTLTSSSASTLSGGSVTQIVVTLTSALPPTSSVVNTSVPVASTQANDGNGGSSALGAIIGGTLGGFAGLLAIVAAVWFFRRRRVNFDEIFEKDYDEYTGKPAAPGRGRMLDLEDEPIQPAAEANTQPQPYVYGLVGSQSPASLNAGISSATNGGRPESSASHGRSSSMAPLLNNGAASRPGSSGDSDLGGATGVSPTPSFTPSAAGMRSVSPGPLGVQIPTGPAFTEPLADSGESPTSVTSPRGPLFVANALDSDSPSGTPRPGTPASPSTPLAAAANKRSSLAVTNVAGPSDSAAAPSATSRSSYAPPPAAYAYLEEKQRLQRDDTVSSGSVYSQPSRAPTPPPARALNVSSQQASGLRVHTDAGPISRPPSEAPPAYQD